MIDLLNHYSFFWLILISRPFSILVFFYRCWWFFFFGNHWNHLEFRSWWRILGLDKRNHPFYFWTLSKAIYCLLLLSYIWFYNIVRWTLVVGCSLNSLYLQYSKWMYQGCCRKWCLLFSSLLGFHNWQWQFFRRRILWSII